jgi:hypothetical protein
MVSQCNGVNTPTAVRWLFLFHENRCQVMASFPNRADIATQTSLNFWLRHTVLYTSSWSDLTNVLRGGHVWPCFITKTKQINGGTRWRIWLRQYTTSQKVAGSISDGVIGIFNWHNPSGRAMALGSTTISWGAGGVEAAGAWGWQPYHLHVPIVLKFGSLILLEPSGPVQACNGIALPLHLNLDS